MDEGGEGVSVQSGSPSMTRLSDFPRGSRFSEINQRLGILDSLVSEIFYNAYLIRIFWGSKEGTMLVLCLAGFLLGSWDIGIGELSSGGDYNRWGILGGGDSGILHMKDMSLILSLLSVICWASFIILLWNSYPIMRENMVYLVIGMAFVQFGYIKTHAENPDFPTGAGFAELVWVIVVNLVMLFLSVFVVRKAVVETRDIHVQQRHFHPDPRVIERAWTDHRLRGWSLGIAIWVVFVNISFWSSTHAVAPSPGDLEFSNFLVLVHVISGLVASFLLLAIVWLPEFMLGAAETRIQSSRAREVAGEAIVEKRVEQGKCPVCNQQTSATMGENGEVSVPCTVDECLGKGHPGSECDSCQSRIPSRVVCSNCGSNTPVGSHFGRVEAW
tara:strand:+ start:1442 stop:2599 length:1158 start_codon:yes stop_codon:yes gene_type:complete